MNAEQRVRLLGCFVWPFGSLFLFLLLGLFLGGPFGFHPIMMILVLALPAVASYYLSGHADDLRAKRLDSIRANGRRAQATVEKIKLLHRRDGQADREWIEQRVWLIVEPPDAPPFMTRIKRTFEGVHFEELTPRASVEVRYDPDSYEVVICGVIEPGEAYVSPEERFIVE
jgi:hypothetical protein